MQEGIGLDELRGLVARIGGSDPATDPAAGIERIRALEELKGAIAAAQARQTVAFEAARRAEHEAAELRANQIGKGIALEVALARRESPYRARLQLGWSRILVDELPHTLKALQSGVTTEWRAMRTGSAMSQRNAPSPFALRRTRWRT